MQLQKKIYSQNIPIQSLRNFKKINYENNFPKYILPIQCLTSLKIESEEDQQTIL